MSKQPQSQRNINRDESSIIAAILRGDRWLFHDLIRPYEKSAYRLVFYLLGDETDAEDTVLRAFLRVFQDLGTFRIGSSFSAWLTSIVFDEVRTQLRKKKSLHTDSSDAKRVGKKPSIMPTELEGLLRRRPCCCPGLRGVALIQIQVPDRFSGVIENWRYSITYDQC
jgi:RNA polymerase sigma factor (sigma-70 family)